MSSEQGFKEIAGRYDGPALEQEVLRFWRDNDVFAATLKASEGRPRFSFNEGPPTANGKPGIHHVLARSFKDAFPRYKTMRGYHVPRKAGWDTHGLPVEHEVEKELGIFDKKEIEQQVGIAEFNRRCRESVMRYIGDWEKMTERMGFWVNLDEAYYTLNNSYIESVWHLLKVIWERGLIYRGYKVVPYDPRIGATLSSHELALGYREVDDPSIYVRFPLQGHSRTSFLVWTTTPWTLPANLSLVVHPEVDYAWVTLGEETLILAEALRESVLEGQDHEVLRVVQGEELLGLRYERPFDFLPVDAESAFRVLPGAFVSTEDGTGIVHSAPAYGVDDLQLGQSYNLPVVHAVGQDGHFLPEVTLVAGLFFKDADKPLIRNLKERGLMFRSETRRHNYPFGWRTGDPIIYYAKNAWYIRTSAHKDRMVDLNKAINWVPATIRDGRFGNWLENNVDWALSRERFWGTPLPVWTDEDDNYLCIGSVAELEALCGHKLSDLDLHRPAVDDVTFEKGGKTWRRVPEVIDCWFDSGAMSYAQWHYPFENRDEFEAHFPADYICEAIDQTRGWFYTLHAIAALVSDEVAYRNCICLSHIVDKDGKKMSKSVGNIVDPYDVFDSVGADALRWYFMARVSPDVQKRISVEIVADVASSFINTFWNTYGFFILYARLDSVDFRSEMPAEPPEIDRWALALLNKTIRTCTDAMDAYDAKTAGEAIESFVDSLSNWYIRRNRRRFWKSTDSEDKRSAYLTLYECLTALHRLMAPFVPFLAEHVHQNLVRNVVPNAPVSVHMMSWPEPVPGRDDEDLLHDIDVVQKVVGLARAARNSSGLRTRQPLSRLLVRAPNEAAARAVSGHRDQILEELNVKSLAFIARDAELVSYRIKPNLPRIGKRYGKLIPAIRSALGNADGGDVAGKVARGERVELSVQGENISLVPEDLLIETSAAEGYACAEDSGYLAALDTSLDDALLREGVARELVRTVQDARKQAGLEVSDRIVLGVSGSAAVTDALAQFRDYLMAETLAIEWQVGQAGPLLAEQRTLEDQQWTIEISKA